MKKSNRKINQSLAFLPRITFAFIAVGFTSISAWNGFNFYEVLFGLSIAIIIGVTLEVARFVCLLNKSLSPIKKFIENQAGAGLK